MNNIVLEKVHGIIIKTVDYGDYDKIITVFTEDEGLVSFIAKGALRPKNRGTLPISPLLEADFFYVNKPGSTLCPCQEITPKNHFTYLRENLDKLDTACKMARAISATQLPGFPAPPLFLLLRYYLMRMKECQRPKNLLSSFLLKLLRHEGIIPLPIRCSTCETTLGSLSFYHNTFYCGAHTFPTATPFSSEDIATLTLLAYSRNPLEIESCLLDESMHVKIESLFYGHTRNS